MKFFCYDYNFTLWISMETKSWRVIKFTIKQEMSVFVQDLHLLNSKCT